MRQYHCKLAAIGVLLAVGIGLNSCGTNDSPTALAPANRTASARSTVDADSPVSLQFQGNPEETTLADTALFFATLNLPIPAINPETVAEAASRLSDIDIPAGSIDPSITPSSAIGLFDYAQPIPGLNVVDGAVLFVTSTLPPDPPIGQVEAGIANLLGPPPPGAELVLTRVPGQALPIESIDLQFVGIPDEVSLIDDTIPGDVSLTVRPNLSPVAAVEVEVSARGNNQAPSIRPIPASELSEEYNCSPVRNQCSVPANDAILNGGSAAIPPPGTYDIKVSVLNARGEVLETNEREIRVVF